MGPTTQLSYVCVKREKKNSQSFSTRDILIEEKWRVLLCMYIYTSQDLIEEHFDMIRGQVLWRDDDLVKVTLHKLRNHVSDQQRNELERERKKKTTV